MMEREPGATRPAGEAAAAGRPHDEGRRPRGRRFAWWLLAVVLAFAAGFGWQYVRAVRVEAELERTEQALAVERLRVGLAQAAVAAQSGDYEAARRQMSDFFTAIQQRLGELPPDVRAVGEQLLLSRDDVITRLSRSSPESADMLYRMLVSFRTAVGDAPPRAAPAGADTGAAPAG